MSQFKSFVLAEITEIGGLTDFWKTVPDDSRALLYYQNLIEDDADLNEAAELGLQFKRAYLEYLKEHLGMEYLRISLEPFNVAIEATKHFIHSQNKAADGKLSQLEIDVRIDHALSTKYPGIAPSNLFDEVPQAEPDRERLQSVLEEESVPRRRLPAEAKAKFLQWKKNLLAELEAALIANYKLMLRNYTKQRIRLPVLSEDSKQRKNVRFRVDELLSAKWRISDSWFELEEMRKRNTFLPALCGNLFEMFSWYPWHQRVLWSFSCRDRNGARSKLIEKLSTPFIEMSTPGYNFEVEFADSNLERRIIDLRQLHFLLSDYETLLFAQGDTYRKRTLIQARSRISYLTKVHEMVLHAQSAPALLAILKVQMKTLDEAVEIGLVDTPPSELAKVLDGDTLLNGLKWYGYNLHPAYWSLREIVTEYPHLRKVHYSDLNGTIANWQGADDRISKKTIFTSLRQSKVWRTIYIMPFNLAFMYAAIDAGLPLIEKASEFIKKMANGGEDLYETKANTVSVTNHSRDRLDSNSDKRVLTYSSTRNYFKSDLPRLAAFPDKDQLTLEGAQELNFSRSWGLSKVEWFSVISAMNVQISKDGFAPLPSFVGFKIDGITVRDGNDAKSGNVNVFIDEGAYHVYSKDGLNFLRFKKAFLDRHKISSVNYTTFFKSDLNDVANSADVDFFVDDIFYNELELLSEAGLKVIARKLKEAASNQNVISARKIIEIIKSNSRYTYSSEKYLPMLSFNPYAYWNRFEWNGCLYYQCNGAATLSKHFFSRIDCVEPSITLQLVKGYGFDDRNSSFNESQAHVWLRMSFPKSTGRGYLDFDATPGTEEEPPSSHLLGSIPWKIIASIKVQPAIVPERKKRIEEQLQEEADAEELGNEDSDDEVEYRLSVEDMSDLFTVRDALSELESNPPNKKVTELFTLQRRFWNDPELKSLGSQLIRKTALGRIAEILKILAVYQGGMLSPQDTLTVLSDYVDITGIEWQDRMMFDSRIKMILDAVLSRVESQISSAKRIRSGEYAELMQNEALIASIKLLLRDLRNLDLGLLDPMESADHAPIDVTCESMMNASL